MTLSLAHGHPLNLMHRGNQLDFHLHLLAAVVTVMPRPLVVLSTLRAALEVAELEAKATLTMTRLVTLRIPNPIYDWVGSLLGTFQIGLHRDLHFLAAEA